MVELAAAGGPAAAGERAVRVAGADEAFLGGGGSVGGGVGRWGRQGLQQGVQELLGGGGCGGWSGGWCSPAGWAVEQAGERGGARVDGDDLAGGVDAQPAQGEAGQAGGQAVLLGVWAEQVGEQGAVDRSDAEDLGDAAAGLAAAW